MYNQTAIYQGKIKTSCHFLAFHLCEVIQSYRIDASIYNLVSRHLYSKPYKITFRKASGLQQHTLNKMKKSTNLKSVCVRTKSVYIKNKQFYSTLILYMLKDIGKKSICFEFKKKISALKQAQFLFYFMGETIVFKQ